MGRPGHRLTSPPAGWGHLALAVAAGAVPVAFLVVFFVVPVAGMLERGLLPDGRPDLAGALEPLGRPRVLRAVWFTAWSSAVATAVTLLLGVPTAYVLHRLVFPGRGLLRGLVTVPFVLPTVVVGVAFRTLLADSGPLGRLGLDGTPAAIVAALVFFNVSVVVRTVGPWWEGLDPRRAEAATALGAGPWQVARTVTLPALLPAIGSAASVVFLFCATAFGVVLTLGGVRYSTVESEIYLLTTQFLDLQAAATLSVLQVLVVVALLLLAGRASSAGRPAGHAGRARTDRRPRRTDLPALVAAGAVVALVVAPLATLAVRSLRPGGTWGLDHYARLGRADPEAGVVVPVTTALANSLRVAVDATLLAVVLGLVVAVLVTRPGTGVARRLTRVLDGLFMLPLGVSAVTLGFGFLVALDAPPLDLRGSPWLLPVAQAMVALPLVVRIVVPALRAVDPRQREAAATLGAGPLRALVSVDLALGWRAVVAAAGFAFAVSLGEFGATSFLARPDFPTLPVVIFDLLGRPESASFGTALAASVVLGAAAAAVTVAVDRLRPPSAGVP